jgi:hypothetical protein
MIKNKDELCQIMASPVQTVETASHITPNILRKKRRIKEEEIDVDDYENQVRFISLTFQVVAFYLFVFFRLFQVRYLFQQFIEKNPTKSV